MFFFLEILELFYYQRCCKADWKQIPCVFYDSEDKAWLLKRKREIIAIIWRFCAICRYFSTLLVRLTHLFCWKCTYSPPNLLIIIFKCRISTRQFHSIKNNNFSALNRCWNPMFFHREMHVKAKPCKPNDISNIFSSFDIYLYSTEEKL